MDGIARVVEREPRDIKPLGICGTDLAHIPIDLYVIRKEPGGGAFLKGKYSRYCHCRWP